MPLHIASRADDADKHQNDVNEIIFHKGKLFSAGDDGKIKVWSSDLTFLKEIQAHQRSVFSLAASNDTLYSCSNDGTVKAWNLDTLTEKSTLIDDEEVEIWKLKFTDGVLYIGDDQGNLRIYKKDAFYGSINFAIPIKDLAIKDTLVFASKNNDVIVTELHLQGDKPQFGLKDTLTGRGPLIIIGDKVVYLSRDGRDLILNQISNYHHIKELAQLSLAHKMIVNGGTSANWNAELVFTGGWDRVVKQWTIADNNLHHSDSCEIDFVINTLTVGETGQLYAAGGDGHITRLDL